MVCSKCQKLVKPTSLATPGVKKKNDMYYGSPSGSGSGSRSGSSKSNERQSATLGNNGIGKSKLLSKSAKNPYAAYSINCSSTTCGTKIESGRKYCQKCAYKANACAICGKVNSKSNAAAPVIAGQKFTLK